MTLDPFAIMLLKYIPYDFYLQDFLKKCFIDYLNLKNNYQIRTFSF